MKAIIWGRVSTVQQEVEMQVEELINLAIGDGFNKEDLYVIKSKGASAICQNDLYLQEINELMETLTNNAEYKTVYVWEVSRLARVESTFHIIKEFLVSNKIQLVVKTPYMKLLTPDGELNFAVAMAFSLMATMASQEMVIKKARMMRGKETNKLQGKFTGGLISFGYTTDKDGYIIIDDEKAETVRYIFNEYANNEVTANEIYHTLQIKGLWGNKKAVDTYAARSLRVTNIIRNKAYIGEKGYPQIVDKETWDLANSKLKHHKSKSRNTNIIYYGKDILFRADGCKYYGAWNKNYYFSREDLATVNLNAIDTIIWDAAIKVNDYYQEDRIDELHEEYLSQFRTALYEFGDKEKQMKELELKVNKVNKLYINGRLNEQDYEVQYQSYQKQLIKVKSEFATTQLRCEELQRLINKTSRVSAFINDRPLQLATTSEITQEAQRYEVIKKVIDKVIVTKIADKHFTISVTNKIGYNVLTYDYYRKGHNITITSNGETIPMIMRVKQKRYLKK